MKTKQHSFFDTQQTKRTKRKYSRTTHGGESSKGKRKEYRPLAENKWIHLTLKSEKAKGAWSFLTPKNKAIIDKVLKEKSKKWGVKIAEYVNVGNHLHIKLKFKYRKGFQNLLRAITTLIARKITNARKGHEIKITAKEKREKQNKFWQGLAFTRVLKTSFEELQLKGYFKANRIQAQKGEKAREQYLNAFNEWIQSLHRGYETG